MYRHAGIIALLLSMLSPAMAGESISVGTAQEGHLENGFEVPIQNRWIQFYRKVAERQSNFSTLELAALLTRASRVVHENTGGTLLTIGDCSDADGGDLRGHRSHNSGRDVDILFYTTDARGRSVPSPGFKRFDRDGAASRNQLFDVRRNWWLVRTLLASDAPHVQYIFVANHLRNRMLDFAKRNGESKEILRRARYILMQPRDALPHDDHFHVRVYCSEGDRESGCVDTGPKWAWIGD